MKSFFGNTFERFVGSHPVLNKMGGDKNNFGRMSSPASSGGESYIFINEDDRSLVIIQYIFIVIAVYLAMKCKKSGNISVVQVILAIVFAPLYILYRLVKPCM